MLSFQRPESACFILRHGHGPPGTPNRGAHWRTTNRGFYFVIKTTWSSRHRPQLFFVGAGLRARPQDFSKGNTGSEKNGKNALPARFHSALARAGVHKRGGENPRPCILFFGLCTRSGDKLNFPAGKRLACMAHFKAFVLYSALCFPAHAAPVRAVTCFDTFFYPEFQ